MLAELCNCQSDYFFFHHSDADTMEILDSAQMDRAVAMWAAYTYVVGNLEEMLPRLEPGEEAPTQEVCPHAQLNRRAASICWYGSDQAWARPQQELDEVFGPVDLGAPGVCVEYLSARSGSLPDTLLGRFLASDRMNTRGVATVPPFFGQFSDSSLSTASNQR